MTLKYRKPFLLDMECKCETVAQIFTLDFIIEKGRGGGQNMKSHLKAEHLYPRVDLRIIRHNWLKLENLIVLNFHVHSVFTRKCAL